MNLVENERVCRVVESDSCDVVYEITNNETLGVAAAWLIGKPLAVAGILLIAVVARWLLHRLIDRLATRMTSGVMPHGFSRTRSGPKATVSASAVAARREQRARAMASLLKSVVTGVVFAMAAIMALSEIGIDVAPLIASAGIVGVALGFGAQSLVKDFISGIFMILEDQYGVGDVIDVGEAIGTVEAVSLRVTRIRDLDGTVWYVRNGEILRIGNMSQNWAQTVLDIPVSYDEDLHRVRAILKDVAHDMWDDDEYRSLILEEPEVWGIQSLDPDGVTVRVVLKTAPMEQWGIAREMRERIVARFEIEGIEIPRPQRVLWHRDSPAVKAKARSSENEPAGAEEAQSSRSS